MPLLCVVFLLCLLRHLSSVVSDSSAKKKTSLLFAPCAVPFVHFFFFSYCSTTNISTWKHINFVCFFLSILHRPLIPTHNNIICFFFTAALGIVPFFLVCLFLSSTLCVSVCWCMKKKGRFLTWEFQTFQETPFHLLLSTPACWDGNFSSPTKYYISHHCGLLFSFFFFFSHMAGICDTVSIFSFFSFFFPPVWTGSVLLLTYSFQTSFLLSHCTIYIPP